VFLINSLRNNNYSMVYNYLP